MKKTHFIAPLGLLLLASKTLAVDTNGDGMCDVWEARFHAGALAPELDTDSDGFTNLKESIAGTDPFDPISHPNSSVGELANGNLDIVVPTEMGKSYQLLSSTSLTGDWDPVGDPHTGDGSEMTLSAPQSGDQLFYRVAVSDLDNDGDGVSDWAENLLSGFDAVDDDSFSSGTADNDLAAATEILQALLNGEVTASVTQQDAYEKEGLPARVGLTRSGATTYPLTVFMKNRGAEEPEKSSAAATDYTFGSPQSGRIVIPAGQTNAELLVQPVKDAKNEVPEELRIDIPFVADGLLTRICDAANTTKNERFFYAAYSSEVGSPASGYSYVRLQGDNEIGLVSSVFSGITSAQSSAQIYLDSGARLTSLRFGQLTDHVWRIEASQVLGTDQAVLNALFAGQLYSDVGTEINPSGEIRADYLLTTGSTEFVTPPDAPEVFVLTGDDLDRDIARFLTQSTFGPTPELMSELRLLVESSPHNGDRISAFSAWLDEKLDPALTPPLSLELFCVAEDKLLTEIYTGNPEAAYYNASFNPSQNSRLSAWWTAALFSDDQVRQRLATALSEILVTSSQESVVDQRHYGHTQYYDMLADGITGSYRELLEGVSTHPIMGHYLSSLRNQKEVTDSSGAVVISPDENYAREIMQLFSIGLVQLHPDGSLKLSASGQPIPTYGQEDIVDLARVFTGWSFSVRNNPSGSDTVVDNTSFTYGNGNRYYQAQWTNPMKQFPDFHDTAAKSVLGLEMAAAQSGEAELTAILDHLAAHANIAPFISKRLIQRLVTSNPSSGYVHRVASVWIAEGGNLTKVAKAILLDPEARSLEFALLVGNGKKKEPLIQYVGLARALQANTELKVTELSAHDMGGVLGSFPADAGYFREGSTEGTLGQTPLDAPTVFNWFYPDYSTGDAIADAGLVTPEFQIATEINTITHINRNYTLTTSSSGESAGTLPNYSELGYGNNADHLIPDVSQGAAATQAREVVYMAVMDENGDGIISAAGDPGTFDNPAKIREACAALVDHLDLLLCAGTLKADYGASADPENPRDIIIDFLAANATYLDNDDIVANQELVRHERYEKAAYLISNSPQSMIQR
ncbi:MAG: DUF1800 family protein [Akkermansiaceae bacterium]|nr:DUF1800 family protein [Akkermansiaceae bacterium]MDP4896349.1 DUF1800 family protein [Akkermansiaceae bacterium]MDP4996207.1 DUF1800 family protein [Akkermansiaceae bacterium]